MHPLLTFLLSALAFVLIAVGVASWWYVIVNINTFPKRVGPLDPRDVMLVAFLMVISPLVGTMILALLWRV